MTEVELPSDCRASLEKMLAEGWTVEPPVYARRRWHLTAGSKRGNTYHFVLWRQKQVHLVSVPEGPEIEQFLADHGLPVDTL